MNTTKLKIPLRVFLLISICCMLCACQTDNALSKQPIQPDKAPQQLLEEQPIDDTHDAFLIDTGGKLGMLLITVATEESNGPMELMLRFSVWDPAHADTPIQTMIASSDCFHNHEIMDANFDGYMDFGYVFAMGNMPYYEHLWI